MGTPRETEAGGTMLTALLDDLATALEALDRARADAAAARERALTADAALKQATERARIARAKADNALASAIPTT